MLTEIIPELRLIRYIITADVAGSADTTDIVDAAVSEVRTAS
jgi:hypothetical protein